MAKQSKKSKNKAAPKSKGLGDSIEKFTKKTGIKKAVDIITKAAGIDDCGCDERKKALNKMFPYRNIECLTDEEYSWLHQYFSSRKSSVSYEEQVKMIEIHNRVLAARREVSSCVTCVRDMANVLKRLYLEYKK
tara:strand:- start:1670 stop:2071 length:402 start_codon:yes stop_codon:yes gene_type:complete